MELKNKNSRRDFLRDGSLLAGGILISSAIQPFAAIFATAKKEGAEHWYGMAIDIEKCIGCGNCVRACKSENNVPSDPFYFRTWIEQYTVMNDGTLNISSVNGGLDGASQSYSQDEIFKSFFVP